MKKIPKNFILDVDGVMTDGKFIYSDKGKIYKIFGAHDSDGLKLIKNKMSILFVTADLRGFKISKRRIYHDLGFEIKLITENERYKFIKENFDLSETIYMGDGFYDKQIIKNCSYGICPKNARLEAKKAANFITPNNGGEGAVFDACKHILKKFFKIDLER